MQFDDTSKISNFCNTSTPKNKYHFTKNLELIAKINFVSTQNKSIKNSDDVSGVLGKTAFLKNQKFDV